MHQRHSEVLRKKHDLTFFWIDIETMSTNTRTARTVKLILKLLERTCQLFVYYKPCVLPWVYDMQMFEQMSEYCTLML